MTIFNGIRAHLNYRDEWKITYCEIYQLAYSKLWRHYLKQGQVLEALITAEEARAQALRDLMEAKYTFCEVKFSWFSPSEKSSGSILRSIPTTTVFEAFSGKDFVFWVVHSDDKIDTREKELEGCVSEEEVREFISTLNSNGLEEIGARDVVTCENRSLFVNCDEGLTIERAPNSVSRCPLPKESLRKLYDIILAPVADLVHGDDLILIPEGPLCLVPMLHW